MNSHDEEWWVLQSGEYVLGTLLGPERETFTKLLEHDPDARRYVVWWQERLSHLDASVVKATPPARVWQSLCEQLGFASERYTPERVEEPVPIDTSVLPLNQHSAMGRRVTFWRGLTGLATAAMLVMGIIFWQNRISPSNMAVPSFDVISVVSGADSSTIWVIDASPRTKQLRVTAVSPPELEDGKSFELWLVKRDDQGVSSMGLLPAQSGMSVYLHAPALVDDGVGFAVSLEPEGGSPGAAPTGPVLFQGSIQKLSVSTIL